MPFNLNHSLEQVRFSQKIQKEKTQKTEKKGKWTSYNIYHGHAWFL